MILSKLPRLNESQEKKLSDIASDLGIVSIASVVLPALFDRSNPIMVILGLLTAVGFWIFSIWLRRH